jgi:hypothetical protein
MTQHTRQVSGIWQAGAFLYSGRPDPRWSVPASTVAGVMAVWDDLPQLAAWREPPSRLGYRGCWLEAPDGRRWIAGDRAVAFYAALDVAGSRGHGSKPTDVRRDDERAFERALLASAPAETPVPSV